MSDPPKETKTTTAVGRRTGIRVDTTQLEVSQNGMEDPAAFFAAATNNEQQRTISFAAASPPSSHKHPRHLINNRKSVDTNDLSAVLTAAPDPPTQEEDADAGEIPVEPTDDDIANEVPEPQNDEEEDLMPPPPPDDDDDDPMEQGDSDDIVGDEEEDGKANSASAGQNQDPKEAEDNVLLDTQPEEEEEVPPSTDPPMEDQHVSDDDEDKEGPGFDINGGDEQEEDTEPEPKAPKTKKKTTEPKKKAGKRKKLPIVDNNATDEEEEPVRPKKTAKSRKKKQTGKSSSRLFSPKGFPQARSYGVVPLSDLAGISDPDDPPHVRRSKRVRFPPLQHWCNERLLYGPNDFDEEEYDGVRNMSVPTGVQKPNPTPYKKRPTKNKASGAAAGGKATKKAAAKVDEEFDLTALRKKYKIHEGKHADVWDETTREITSTKIVSYFNQLDFQPLPIPRRSRTKKEGSIVGLAAQSFNVAHDSSSTQPSFIMGSLRLPPGGIKDAEPVGNCFQLFTIVSCQPKALELALADPDQSEEGEWDPKTAQRFYLKEGDNFTVPQGNTYRIQNRSASVEAVMSWSIVRPYAVDDGDLEEDGETDDEEEEE